MKKKIFVVSIILLSLPVIALAGDLSDFLRDFEEMVLELDDYQCRIAQWSVSSKSTEEKIMNYYYNASGRIRIDVLESTWGAGSTGVLRSDGKVEVVPPFQRVRLKIVLNADHARVKTNRGRTFYQSSLPGILESLESMRNGWSIGFREEGDLITLSSSDGESKREIMQFDRETLLPVQHEVYENNRIVERVFWSGYVLNAELPDKLFNAKLRMTDVERMTGIEVAAMPISSRERSVANDISGLY